MWKVVTSFNLNSPLKLFFYSSILTNNNLLLKIYCKNIVKILCQYFSIRIFYFLYYFSSFHFIFFHVSFLFFFFLFLVFLLHTSVQPSFFYFLFHLKNIPAFASHQRKKRERERRKKESSSAAPSPVEIGAHMQHYPSAAPLPLVVLPTTRLG